MIYFLRILVSVAVAACVLQQSDQSPAADWPQWMGPELNGISLERGGQQTGRRTAYARSGQPNSGLVFPRSVW